MKNYRRLLSLIPLLLTACGALTSSVAASGNGVSVSLHGVNYTDRPFQYVVIDPNDQHNSGGGEHIGPFSAGGTVCCYVLPKQWSPGIQVQVRATHWLPKDVTGKLPEVTKVYTVEIPQYVNGEVGELWVLGTEDGNIEVISSNYQPNHPNWPGKTKGWPQPSADYRREKLEQYRKSAEGDVEAYRRSIAELESNRNAHLEESWAYDQKYRRDKLSTFKGAHDPAYEVYLRNRYADGLARTLAKLAKLSKDNP